VQQLLVLEVLAKHWEQLGKSQNNGAVHEILDLCQEIGWEEVVGFWIMLSVTDMLVSLT